MAYIRKTRDVYELQGNYGYGWDILTTEKTYKDAKEQKKCYQENEHGYYRIVKKRERIGE